MDAVLHKAVNRKEVGMCIARLGLNLLYRGEEEGREIEG